MSDLALRHMKDAKGHLVDAFKFMKKGEHNHYEELAKIVRDLELLIDLREREEELSEGSH